MKRDPLLFTLAGVMIGFIAAYFAFELVAERQPQRLIPGTAAVGAPVIGGQGAAPGSGPGPGPGAGAGAARAPFLERVAALERRVAADPADSAALIELGNLYFDVQNWSGAAEAYGRFLDLEPERPDVLSDLGVSLQRLGRAQEALAMFDRAQELEPDHWQSRYNEVVVLAFDLGRWSDAERVLGELRELQPGNADVERLAAAVEERKNAA